MLERNLYDQYKLYCEERFSIGPYECIRANNQAYIILPKDELQSEEQQMIAFSTYMRTAGDESVLELVPSRSNQPSALIDGMEVYLFKLPDWGDDRGVRIQSTWDLGGQLHAWHAAGQQGQANWDNAVLGQWPTLWATRLEQLEDWYQSIFSQGPKTLTDEAFLYTYPYFMGLTENAIQYAVDTRLDVPMEATDVGTICHRRFNESSWLRLSENGQIVKPPTTFLFDHRARDLAEWVRDKRDDPRGNEEILSFLGGYEELQTLSPYSWQLMFSRLLFPLHYFETIENYYRAQIPNQKRERATDFQTFLDNEKSNVDFLSNFAEEAKLSRYQAIPALDWLPGQKL
ncbi:spore coat putative kinase YutH [Shouchella patagoniensis]|uniref:spore coat putative kinase YutH n=1 Tax=Shouchella patagoniensis TaxID=228576 RepID=UPI00099502F3|nr:spore coat protein YutH [Shouchella patagoniensis]